MEDDESDIEQIRREMAAINDPRRALEAVMEYEGFFGFDPYYRDIRAAVIEMASRVLDQTKWPDSEKG